MFWALVHDKSWITKSGSLLLTDLCSIKGSRMRSVRSVKKDCRFQEILFVL